MVRLVQVSAFISRNHGCGNKKENSDGFQQEVQMLACVMVRGGGGISKYKMCDLHTVYAKIPSTGRRVTLGF